MKLKNNFPVGLTLLTTLFLWGCSSGKKEVPDTQWALLPFAKVDSVNPVLFPGDNIFRCPIIDQNIKWENKDVFNPAAVVKDNKVFLVYRAEDTIGRFNGTSRLGLAVSEDGFHFIKEPAPVFYPDNDSIKFTSGKVV